jgi:hypothetical protein
MGIFASKGTSHKANIVLVHGFWADGSGCVILPMVLQIR